MTGNKYRIGQDRTILWSVLNKDGTPFSLADKVVRLFITHERGQEEVEISVAQNEDGSVSNVVSWVFKGEEQRVLGSYNLTLMIECLGKRTIRKDICDAFVLVGAECLETEEEGGAYEDGATLTLTSELDIYTILPVVPTIGENGNWWVDGVDTGKGAVPANIPVLTLSPLNDAQTTIIGFEEYGLIDRIGEPIACLFSTSGEANSYKLANLIVEEVADYAGLIYRLNFLVLGAQTYDNIYKTECKIANSYCYAYLYNRDYKYIVPLGESTLVLADTEMNAESEYPIANKVFTEKYNEYLTDRTHRKTFTGTQEVSFLLSDTEDYDFSTNDGELGLYVELNDNIKGCKEFHIKSSLGFESTFYRGKVDRVAFSTPDGVTYEIFYNGYTTFALLSPVMYSNPAEDSITITAYSIDKLDQTYLPFNDTYSEYRFRQGWDFAGNHITESNFWAILEAELEDTLLENKSYTIQMPDGGTPGYWKGGIPPADARKFFRGLIGDGVTINDEVVTIKDIKFTTSSNALIEQDFSPSMGVWLDTSSYYLILLQNGQVVEEM